MQANEETPRAFESKVLEELEALKQEQALANIRIDTYQKASNQVVNLAFGLIATATITIIASVILK